MANLIIAGDILIEGATAADSSSLRYFLEDSVTENDLGDIIGGGCELDSAKFDMQIETEKIDEIKALFKKLLEENDLLDKVTLDYTFD